MNLQVGRNGSPFDPLGNPSPNPAVSVLWPRQVGEFALAACVCAGVSQLSSKPASEVVLNSPQRKRGAPGH